MKNGKELILLVCCMVILTVCASKTETDYLTALMVSVYAFGGNTPKRQH